jgi:hypothetical protein
MSYCRRGHGPNRASQKPSSAYVHVACLMTLLGQVDAKYSLPPGCWDLVFRQTVVGGTTWTRANEEWSVNPALPSADQFSILDTLESYRSAGKLTLRLRWPQNYPANPLAADVTWRQASNPVLQPSCATVTGYEEVEGFPLVEPGANACVFGGLQRACRAYALLDGCIGNGNWWWAVGARTSYNGGIPAAYGGYTTFVASQVELYAYNETTIQNCPPPLLPPYSPPAPPPLPPPSPPTPCLSCFEVSFSLKGRVGSEDVVVGAADGCGMDSNINSYDLPTTSWTNFTMHVSDACPYVWVNIPHDYGSEDVYASNLLWDGYDALHCTSFGSLPDTIARTWSGWWGDCGWDGNILSGESSRCQDVRQGMFYWNGAYYFQLCPSAVPPPPSPPSPTRPPPSLPPSPHSPQPTPPPSSPPATALSVQVNFQCSTDSIPSDYIADFGQPYGPHNGGLAYGWDCDFSMPACRNRGRSSDLVLDSPMVIDTGESCPNKQAEWSILVANGIYVVELLFGDPEYGGKTFESCFLQGQALGSVPYPTTIHTVSRMLNVTDGRIRFKGGYGAGCAAINAIHILSLVPPAAPPHPPPKPPLMPPPTLPPPAAPLHTPGELAVHAETMEILRNASSEEERNKALAAARPRHIHANALRGSLPASGAG